MSEAVTVGERSAPRWLIPVIAFDMVTRTIASRRAWQNQQRVWATTLGVVSSAGVLPLVYLLFFQRRPALLDDELVD
jgi:hypothetical protein